MNAHARVQWTVGSLEQSASPLLASIDLVGAPTESVHGLAVADDSARDMEYSRGSRTENTLAV